MTRDTYEDGPRLIGGAELPRVVDTRETRPICGERPETGMGLYRMQHACALPLHHGGERHQAKDGTTFPRKARSYRESFWRRLDAGKQAAGARWQSLGGSGASATHAPSGDGSIPSSRPTPLSCGEGVYNPDDASWETQDRVWADEAVAERDATAERRAGRVLRG